MTNRLPLGLSISLLAAITLGAPALVGCEKKPDTAATDAHDHDHDGHDHGDHDGHDHGDDHGHDHGDDHDHGPTVELGVQTVGTFEVKASRDGELTPGGDAPIDVWITGAGAKVSAVRFWIGAADGKGSMKAKAELEKDNWHTHAEVPSPLPEGSKLWIEIETDGGESLVTGFDLKG